MRNIQNTEKGGGESPQSPLIDKTTTIESVGFSKRCAGESEDPAIK